MRAILSVCRCFLAKLLRRSEKEGRRGHKQAVSKTLTPQGCFFSVVCLFFVVKEEERDDRVGWLSLSESLCLFVEWFPILLSYLCVFLFLMYLLGRVEWCM